MKENKNTSKPRAKPGSKPKLDPAIPKDRNEGEGHPQKYRGK